jgi:hypothetical protein
VRRRKEVVRRRMEMKEGERYGGGWRGRRGRMERKEGEMQ